jgi:hypothetical protein
VKYSPQNTGFFLFIIAKRPSLSDYRYGLVRCKSASMSLYSFETAVDDVVKSLGSEIRGKNGERQLPNLQ